MIGLSDRELASLAWLGLGVVVGLFAAQLRRSAGQVLAALLKLVLLVPLAPPLCEAQVMVAAGEPIPDWLAVEAGDAKRVAHRTKGASQVRRRRAFRR